MKLALSEREVMGLTVYKVLTNAQSSFNLFLLPAPQYNKAFNNVLLVHPDSAKHLPTCLCQLKYMLKCFHTIGTEKIQALQMNHYLKQALFSYDDWLYLQLLLPL